MEGVAPPPGLALSEGVAADIVPYDPKQGSFAWKVMNLMTQQLEQQDQWSRTLAESHKRTSGVHLDGITPHLPFLGAWEERGCDESNKASTSAL